MSGITNDNACAKCEQFNQYYIKSRFYSLEACEYGFCKIKNQIVKTAETCDGFSKQSNKWRDEEVDEAIAVVTELKELLKK